MVPKGLKAGDTFEDGNRLYVVEAVNGDGTYYSRAVENSEAHTAVGTDSVPKGGRQVTRKRRTKKQ